MDHELYEVPDHNHFRIDKSWNIYIIDDDNNVIQIIKKSDVKFRFENKTYYTMELGDTAFYGVPNKMDFHEYHVISDNEISINGIIFRKMPISLDGYYISSTGVVFSTYRNSLRKQEIDRDGYHRISFPYSNMTHIALHRLVYTAWVGPIPSGYVIDHKDNQKWNNDYKNLQAITPFQNSRKAAQDGIYNSSFHWTEDAVKNVCELMAKNLTVKEIADKFGIHSSNKRLYKNFRNQLYHIRKMNRAWVDVSSQYDFSKYTGNIRPDSKFRDEDIREMRKLYASGKTIKDIAEIFNVEADNYFSKLVRGLKRKRVV